jgi:DNA polymerase-3 subunit alpha
MRIEKEICGFEHVHRHSGYSLLDGFATVAEYAEYSSQVNQKFLCISDHGVMGSVPQLIRESEKHNLHPIFACELYVNPMQIETQTKTESQDFFKTLSEEEKKKFAKSNHLLAIAYNEEGYKNLVRLTSWGWLKGFYRKPRVNHDILRKHRDGLIFTSCCANSEIAQAYLSNYEDEEGFAMIEKYIELFGRDNFYLELMMLDFKLQKPYDSFLLRAYDRYKLPLILTQDCHYCKKEHSHNQRLMLMMQTGRTIQEIEILKKANADLFELQDENLWMKAEWELDEKWDQDYQRIIDYELYKEAKRNTVLICEKAKGVKLDTSLKLPQFPDADLKLKEAIAIGMKMRGIKPSQTVYMKRLKEEYELICNKEFSSYFLIQKMMTDEARRVCPELLGFGDGSEAVGCGRGCLIYDSPIYLKDGSIKMLGEVEIGEDVFTNDGSYQTVIGKAKYPINETLLNIKSFYGDWRGITLTKDHKVLVEKHKKVDNYEKWAESTKKSRRKYMEPTGELTWMPASQVEVGDWVFQSFPKVDIEENFVFDLAKTCFGNKKNGSKNNADDNFIINKYKSKTSLRNRFIDLDEIFAVILGLFTGDGWLYSNKPNQVGFACHSDEREVRDFIKDFFEEQGSNVRIEENKQGKNVDVIEVDNFNLTSLFYELFPNYRYTSDTKHVPKCIMNASEKIIQAYLHGYFLSDGSEQKSKIKFETTSYVLANQIRFLLLRLRLPSSLGYSDREDSREAFKNRKPSYSILCPLDDRIASQNIKEKHVWRELKDGILVQVREVNEVKNISEVFDIQVENNSNYLTSSFLVHNSAVGSLICYCLGITDVDPILHDLLFSRFLSPARGGKTIKYLYDCPLIPKVD